MKTTLFTTLVLAGLCTSAGATPFTGAGAPGALTVNNTGGFLPGATATLGTAVATATVLTLVGSNDTAGLGCEGGTYEVPGPCQLQALYGQGGIYSFSWDYSTADISAGGDTFGVLLDGVAQMVYGDPGGPVSESGSATFVANRSFGWYLNCTDCTGGAATVAISNFSVPEPSTLGLVLAAGMAAGWRRRRSAR